MTLKELQGMIKEELESYMNEEEVDVDVDAGDVDADGAESGDDSEDVLRQIYDMLKDKFEDEGEAEEAEEEAEEADDMDEIDTMEEAKDEDQVEESTTDVHTQLQERFKKLANIVKG